MVRFQEFFTSIGSLFTNLLVHPDWHNVADVLILAVLIYQVIKLVMHTRSNSLFKGIAAVLVVAWLANALQLNAVSWVLAQVISMIPTTIFVDSSGTLVGTPIIGALVDQYVPAVKALLEP